MIESQRMPLRSRFAAVHGDPDQAAQQLDILARGFHKDIERLLANETPAPRRRGWRFGHGRSGLRPAPGVVTAPALTA